jgi:hypothetical protein
MSRMSIQFSGLQSAANGLGIGELGCLGLQIQQLPARDNSRIVASLTLPDYGRVARHPSRMDVKRGEQLQPRNVTVHSPVERYLSGASLDSLWSV